MKQHTWQCLLHRQCSSIFALLNDENFFQVELGVSNVTFIYFSFFFYPTDFVVVQSLSNVHLFVIHELQHTRLPCPSLSPRVCSKS